MRVGYKYVSEERALARFEAFCASEFPGLETVTRASVEAWIAAARRRAVKPATVTQSDRAGQRARPLASAAAASMRTCCRPGCSSKPARYVPHIYTDRELGGAVRGRPTAAATARRCRSGIW